MTESKLDPTTLFAPIEAAVVKAFALRSGDKALASLRPLMWLAYLALAQWFGLAHLITPEMRTMATELARRPGRRKTEPDGQTSLLDLMPLNDGRPGTYVSLARLALGNVCDRQGGDVLDLIGITELPDALVKAYEQGWIGGPSGNGVRFIPPTIWGLVVDHNSAGFARNGGVDEYVAALQETDRQWQIATGANDPHEAKELADLRASQMVNHMTERDNLYERIGLLETSIAESARLPTTPIAAVESCPHKSQTLGKNGARTCDDCNEPLPPISKNGRVKAERGLGAKQSPKTTSAKRTVKKSSKGRVS
jgi:hypothetical protein